MKTLPLFGSGVRSYADIVTRQRRLNCIYDLRQDQDQSAVVLLGTPGAALYGVTLPTSPIRGWHIAGALLYVVAGSTLYSINTYNGVTAIGTLVVSGSTVSMADNSNQLIIVDGFAGYICNLVSNTLTQISDVNFPNGCTSVTFLNSRFICNVPNSRTFVVSQVLDGTSWTPYIYGTKENSSDLLVEVDVLNGNLVLWGQRSIEMWQDVGSSPLPYQRINGATQQWGLAARDSHVHIGTSEIFLGVNPDGGVKVVKIQGYTPVPVSNSDIEYLISNFANINQAVAMVYNVYGHSIYHLTFPSENRTLAYDDTTGIWHEAQTGTAPYGRHFGNLSIAFNAKTLVSDSTSGIIYALDPDVYTDNGANIRREVCTRHLRADGNELHLSRLLLEMPSGVGNTSSVNPVVTIRISRDGGSTFGPEKQRPLGKVGKYLSRAIFNRLGWGRDIVIMIAVTDPVLFGILSGSADMEIANS